MYVCLYVYIYSIHKIQYSTVKIIWEKIIDIHKHYYNVIIAVSNMILFFYESYTYSNQKVTCAKKKKQKDLWLS